MKNIELIRDGNNNAYDSNNIAINVGDTINISNVKEMVVTHDTLEVLQVFFGDNSLKHNNITIKI